MRRRLGLSFCLCILTLLGCGVDSWGANKPNIVLLTLDSVRSDRIGFSGGHAGLSPNLDRIAKDSVVFLQAYAQAPTTTASHATILTGAFPQVHRASDFGVPLPLSVPYLPEVLHANGYTTAAFVGSIALDPKNGPFQAYDRGFDVYDTGFQFLQPGENHQSVSRHAEEVVARATKWLAATQSRPFFIWINLHDADDAKPSSYDRSIAVLDSAFGKVASFLKAQSLYDDAVIIAVSAHGQSLGAHGEDTHGLFLYDETIHVPLLMKLPRNQMAGKQVKNRAPLVDVAPTLLEAAGIAVTSRMQGQSLLRVAQSTSQADQPSYARSDFPQQSFQTSAVASWRAGKWLYIRAPKPELYDLNADPGATRNLAESSKATLDTLASQVQSFEERLGSEPGKGSGTSLTSSEMQKLASLGYVGLQKSASTVDASTNGVDPKNVVAVANTTIAAVREIDNGKPEVAIASLKTVSAEKTDFYLAQYAMGIALYLQKHYSEAIPYLHKAIELQADSPWAYYTMGVCLSKTGDFKGAAVHLEIASRRLPGFAASHSALANVELQLKGQPHASKESNKNE